MRLNQKTYSFLERFLPLIAVLLSVPLLIKAESILKTFAAVVIFIVYNVLVSKITGRFSGPRAYYLELSKHLLNVIFLILAPVLFIANTPLWLLGLLPLVRAVAVFSESRH